MLFQERNCFEPCIFRSRFKFLLSLFKPDPFPHVNSEYAFLLAPVLFMNVFDDTNHFKTYNHQYEKIICNPRLLSVCS